MALGLAYVAAGQAIRRLNGCATVTVCYDGVARVEALNGRLDVDRPPQQGTRITAETLYTDS